MSKHKTATNIAKRRILLTIRRKEFEAALKARVFASRDSVKFYDRMTPVLPSFCKHRLDRGNAS
jgi:hypothetical protein